MIDYCATCGHSAPHVWHCAHCERPLSMIFGRATYAAQDAESGVPHRFECEGWRRDPSATREEVTA